MDASQCDVVSGVWENWNSIDWAKVHRTTRRLQTRIAKAVRAGDRRGARRLQRLLAHSTSGKLLAVRRVTENHGRKTAGVDHVKWPTASQAELIGSLNPLIRGWAQYHRCVAVNEVFRKMDHLLFSALWRWSLRRHPSKGRRWIKRRYFRKEGARDGVFSVKGFRLLRFSDFSYREHVKIKSEANPYDPQWEHYFAKRLAQQMMQTLVGRRKLLGLWNKQDGKCPFCHLPVT